MAVASNFRELEAACAALHFHVAVLGPGLGARVKRAVARLLQQKCPYVPIIELFHGSPVVDGAIHFSGDPGQELIAKVKTAVQQI